jgi:ribosomal protein L6P/L9E
MSRIGKMPIELPKGVNVDVKGSEVVVKISFRSNGRTTNDKIGPYMV